MKIPIFHQKQDETQRRILNCQLSIVNTISLGWEYTGNAADFMLILDSQSPDRFSWLYFICKRLSLRYWVRYWQRRSMTLTDPGTGLRHSSGGVRPQHMPHWMAGKDWSMSVAVPCGKSVAPDLAPLKVFRTRNINRQSAQTMATKGQTSPPRWNCGSMHAILDTTWDQTPAQHETWLYTRRRTLDRLRCWFKLLAQNQGHWTYIAGSPVLWCYDLCFSVISSTRKISSDRCSHLRAWVCGRWQGPAT